MRYPLIQIWLVCKKKSQRNSHEVHWMYPICNTQTFQKSVAHSLCVIGTLLHKGGGCTLGTASFLHFMLVRVMPVLLQ